MPISARDRVSTSASTAIRPGAEGTDGTTRHHAEQQGGVAHRRGERAADLGADGVDQLLRHGDRDGRGGVEGGREHLAVAVDEVGEVEATPASSALWRPPARRTDDRLRRAPGSPGRASAPATRCRRIR